ncbi:ATP-binding protein [Roseixanthobacter pseudopolyaromaticivorans]|uniref:ATP-binding protein n=1 Tax=Xanthobacteraceae TaxID=335928 RepID=UPI0037267C41
MSDTVELAAAAAARVSPSTRELDVFRTVDFDWTRHLKSVWRDPQHHVAVLHKDCLDDIVGYFAQKTRDPENPDEPLGRVIMGPAGYGKTHLIGQLRRRIWEQGGWFVLLDLVGVKDFWSSVSLGFLNSLQVRRPDGLTQYEHLVLKIAELLGIDGEVEALAQRETSDPNALIRDVANCYLRGLSRHHNNETRLHRDVVTALILLNSSDFDQQSIAHAWLQGMTLDPQDVRQLGFKGENRPIDVVRGLSWLMSLVAPTLIAVDQIDAIVSAANMRAIAVADGGAEEQSEARSIVEALAHGLMDLHETKRRAVTVISCLEATWRVLERTASVAVTARYKDPTLLHPLPSSALARAVVEARLMTAYAATDFVPPYPTWPFAERAFETAIGYSPRQLLKRCEDHRLRCVADGRVTECLTFDPSGVLAPPPAATNDLDPIYARAMAMANVAGLMSLEREDDLRKLFERTLRLFEQHLDLSDDIDVEFQPDPDQKRPSLHGRLTFTFRESGDSEQHYCFRLIGHTNAIAFQSRLAAAMTASGIDRALNFRHLFVLRQGDAPAGPKSRAQVEHFLKAGGRFIAPTDEDLRAFAALADLAARRLPEFDAWLKARKPLCETAVFRAVGLCPPPFLQRAGGEVETKAAANALSHEGTLETSGQADAAAPISAPREIAIGRKFRQGALGEPVSLAADLLSRHVAILAGSGSGKTVLLRRMVEEAALLGIPSIVLDINNDLARLGDRWPLRPDGFTGEDDEKAARYHQRAEVVIWTPGVSGGNPISLNLLPDFAAIGDAQKDERAQAVEMARATLAPFLGGGGRRAQLKEGVLADALRAFAKRGGDLDDLIALLADLPDHLSRIGHAADLAAEIADQLQAVIATNPLLRAEGPKLDPSLLFQASTPDKTRISVINLSGLASDESRQTFVNQLQMALFTWVKQNPSPTSRLYVLDEAQNFAPSQLNTACKASTKSLAAQARKYGLGMVFATQLPRGIDNAIISNCTTHVYGRMSAPATIEATRDLMAAKGGAADDIARLTRGEFYFSTDGIGRPMKIHTPLSLSWHPQNPPTADEVVERARAIHRKLQGA